MAPGYEIYALDNCRRNIIDVHRSFPEPSRPVAIVGVHAAVPKWNKCPWTKGNHVHIAVLSIIISNTFAQNLAAPIQGIRLINTGCGNEDYLVDAEGNGRLENLEGPTHIQVKEIVGIFRATHFVDTVPGSDVDNAIAAME